LPEHLGDEKHAADGRGSGNSRTGTSAKTLKTEQDAKLIALYGRGLAVSDIQAHLEEMYETEVSTGLISKVTNAV